jgi:predicted metal-dependent peptidase
LVLKGKQDVLRCHTIRRQQALHLRPSGNKSVEVIAIAVDGSGSVSARQLRQFETEICSILEGQRARALLRREDAQSSDL